jgi:anti-anti-sigma factor
VDTKPVTVDVMRDYGAEVVRVRVTGDLDERGAGQLRNALAVAATDPPASVEVDLGAVTFFSCAGITALLRARMATGGRIVVVTTSAPVRRLLDVLRLTATFSDPSAPGQGLSRPGPAPTARPVDSEHGGGDGGQRRS